ncbi:MAG: nucleotide exchange factor GrpE [Chlamydiae bacterium]|nr:nucleotide exchange factor GrpE [Chlamydiota bacterium]MBI3267289.1 nucleotide exchange factor GrpE [Chlamydiota bacterium]
MKLEDPKKNESKETHPAPETKSPPGATPCLQTHEVKDKRVWISRKRLEELEKKAQETQFYLDHLQRLQAEFENFRKRSFKEKEEFRKYVLEDFILELVGILDNFERAVSVEGTQNYEGLKTGLQMIYRQFNDCLSRKGLASIEALHQPFDPLRHDAVAYEISKEHPPHQVIAQLSKGYSLHGKVIRPSKVKVSKEEPPKSEIPPEGKELTHQ